MIDNLILVILKQELLLQKPIQLTIILIKYIVYSLGFINNKTASDKYRISCVLRDDRIIKVTITKGKDKNKVIIKDSYLILTISLKNFNVKTIKLIFPYEFSVEDNLLYKGNTPDISFYQDITKQKI